MQKLKQAIVVRKDLKLSRAKLANQVAQATLKFLVENNEAERGGQLHVNLSSDEVTWLTNSFLQDIVGVKTQEQIEEIIFRAEITGVEVYSVFLSETEISCIALGPDTPDAIDKLIHNLKPI